MSTTEHKQAPRTAWINAMRAEVLRVGKRIPEVARVAHVGVWIATYADADGSNSFPGRDTLAVLAGCSQETVTRAVKVLMGVGVLERKRRPNASSMYQLRMFLPGGLAWEEHLHHYTDTRQRRAHAKAKAEVVARVARTASMDAVREEQVDSVHGGGSGSTAGETDSVRGRPWKASVDAVRTASTAGVYKVPPTSGRDPHPDHDPVVVVPQPQERAGSQVEDEFPRQRDEAKAASRPGGEGGPWARRCSCGGHIVRPGRDRCGGCLLKESKAQKAAAHRPVQGAFLLPLAGGGQGAPQGRRERPQWLAEDPTVARRLCGCGKEFRLRDSDRCPDCVYAADAERIARGAVGSA